MAEYRALEKKNVTKKPNALVILQDPMSPAVQSASSGDQYNPCISKDHSFVSLSEHGEKVPIDILRDTGVTQSLLVDDILPLSDSTATGTVQIQGIDLGIVSAPLHVVHLSCNLVNGTITVGLRPTHPVKRISLIVGNDFAGSKVMPDLQTVHDPDPEQVTDDSDGVFPVCAVTRAAARRAKADDQQCDQISDGAANSVRSSSSSASGAQRMEDCLSMS